MLTIVKSEKLSTGDYVQVDSYNSESEPKATEGDKFEYVVSEGESIVKIFKSGS